MMKVFIQWALMATVICATNILSSCSTTGKENQAQAVESIELLRTSQSWDGRELPNYPQGTPEMVAMKYTIPPGQKLG